MNYVAKIPCSFSHHDIIVVVEHIQLLQKLISACGDHAASNARLFQLNFSSQMKLVAIPFPPANLDPLVMWNLSQVKYLPVDAVKKSKEPGDDERQLSAGLSVCSILMGSPDTHKSITEEAPKQMSARWTRLAWPKCLLLKKCCHLQAVYRTN